MIWVLCLMILTAATRCNAGGLAEMLFNSSIPDAPAHNPTKDDADYVQLLKPRGMDSLLINNILRVTVTGAESLMNPCTLQNFVRDNIKTKFQKNKSKLPKNAMRNITRETLLNGILPSLKEGIDLYRSMFVLQETTNLTIFLDQNKDNLYANTVLQNYSHYYIRAGNDDMTQILFIGIVHRSEVEKHGIDLPALQFLAGHGLLKHPRQQVEFEALHPDESDLILEKRQQIAVLLAEQGTFWEDDQNYISNLMSVAFNGPETNAEFVEMLPKIMKTLNHKMPRIEPTLENNYDLLCAQWDVEAGAPTMADQLNF